MLDRVRACFRTRHLARSTEKAYVHWTRRYVRYHGLQHPETLGADEVCPFLSYLAVERSVAASTQNQARGALLFLYDTVLEQPLGDLGQALKARRPRRLPVVLSRDEVFEVLKHLQGTPLLVAATLYGGGVRLIEALRLRVEDLDLAQEQIIVRDGKGQKDRRTVLPARLIEPYRRHLRKVKAIHEEDVAAGNGSVYLPGALARKYPRAATSWAWQYVFPSARRSTDPRSGPVRRHHTSPAPVQ